MHKAHLLWHAINPYSSKIREKCLKPSAPIHDTQMKKGAKNKISPNTERMRIFFVGKYARKGAHEKKCVNMFICATAATIQFFFAAEFTIFTILDPEIICVTKKQVTAYWMWLPNDTSIRPFKCTSHPKKTNSITSSSYRYVSSVCVCASVGCVCLSLNVSSRTH